MGRIIILLIIFIFWAPAALKVNAEQATNPKKIDSSKENKKEIYEEDKKIIEDFDILMNLDLLENLEFLEDLEVLESQELSQILTKK